MRCIIIQESFTQLAKLSKVSYMPSLLQWEKRILNHSYKPTPNLFEKESFNHIFIPLKTKIPYPLLEHCSDIIIMKAFLMFYQTLPVTLICFLWLFLFSKWRHQTTFFLHQAFKCHFPRTPFPFVPSVETQLFRYSGANILHHVSTSVKYILTKNIKKEKRSVSQNVENSTIK